MYKHVKIIDENGEIVSSSSSKLTSQLKDGWIVMYKDGIMQLVKEAPNYATLKVYLVICAAQDYDVVTYISTSYIADELGIAYQTAWNSIKWLIQHHYIKKVKTRGNTGFVVNPLVSTCGKSNVDSKLDYFKDSFDEEYEINKSATQIASKLKLGGVVYETSASDDLDDGDKFALEHRMN